MARRPNYNFEKRQKEIDKARKKEEKAAKKLLRKEGGAGEEQGGEAGEAADAPAADGA